MEAAKENPVQYYDRELTFLDSYSVANYYLEKCFDPDAKLHAGRFLRHISDPYDALLSARRETKMFTKGYLSCILKPYRIKVI